MDAKGDECYKVYFIDGLSNAADVDFSVLENIATKDVYLRRRATTPGILKKGTACGITANNNPEDMFGQERRDILRSRMMTIDYQDVELFDLLNEFCRVHGLQQHVDDEYTVPDDI